MINSEKKTNYDRKLKYLSHDDIKAIDEKVNYLQKKYVGKLVKVTKKWFDQTTIFYAFVLDIKKQMDNNFVEVLCLKQKSLEIQRELIFGLESKMVVISQIKIKHDK